MNGDTVFVLLIVVGLGGLAVWLVTRQPEGTVPLNTTSVSACQQLGNVAIQAGGASQGVKTGDQSGAAALGCDVVKAGEQLLKKTTSGIGSTFGFTTHVTQEDKVALCNGAWGGRATTIGMCDPNAAKVDAPPVTPQIVAARRTFLNTALGGR